MKIQRSLVLLTLVNLYGILEAKGTASALKLKTENGREQTVTP